MKESAIKQKSGYIYAGISFLFALCSGLFSYLSRGPSIIESIRIRNGLVKEDTWLSLEVRSGLELTAVVLAIVSLNLSAIAIGKGSKRLGYIVFIFELLAFVIVPIIFVK